MKKNEKNQTHSVFLEFVDWFRCLTYKEKKAIIIFLSNYTIFDAGKKGWGIKPRKLFNGKK
jgi:hypothetical protein